MKIYGYETGEALNVEGLVELREVSFFADAKSLRRVAAFLRKQAGEMDTRKGGFDHAHAQDEDRPWPEEWADVIVVKSAGGA